MTATTFSLRGVGLRVRRALARVPLACLRRRVVTRLVGDVVVARLVVRLLEEVANRLHDLNRLRARRSLEREVGREQHVGIAFAFVLDRRARARRQRLDARAAPTGSLSRRASASLVVVAATPCREQCEHGDRQGQNAPPTTLSGNHQLSPPPSYGPSPTTFCTRLRSPRCGRMAKYPGNGREFQLCAAALRSLNRMGQPTVPRTPLPRRPPEHLRRLASRPAKPASGPGSGVQRRREVPSRSKPKWRNWQTRRTQNPVPLGECGFDSHLRHHSTTALAGWLSRLSRTERMGCDRDRRPRRTESPRSYCTPVRR